MKKISILLCVCVLVFTFAGSASALIWNYDYTALLYPTTLNGGGSPPATATAAGTFWYDDTSPSSLGYYPLGGLTFNPDLTTTASAFDCDPITGCLSENALNFAEYNPTSNVLNFQINSPLQAYFLEYSGGTTDFGFYSSNNASGDVVDLEIGEGSPVPEPTTMLLFGAGLVGLAGFGRKKFKK